MAHNPLNHPLRPIYRALGALAGIWLVLLGIVGIIVNAGDDFFATHTDQVLGQGLNMFGSIISLVTGIVVVLATVIGRNLDTEAYKFLGWGVLAVASYGLATSRTDANFLGFSIVTVIVDYLVGVVLVLAGLYIKTGPTEQSGERREVRESDAREKQSA